MLAWQVADERAEDAIGIRSVHMWFEEVSFIVQVQLVLLGMDA